MCSVGIISGDCTENSLNPRFCSVWSGAACPAAGCVSAVSLFGPGSGGANLLFSFDQITRTPRCENSQCVFELNVVPVRDGHTCKKGFLCSGIAFLRFLDILKKLGVFLEMFF